ncbi:MULTISPECIES: hypothetical protein [Streptomyces]|jgi:hypothetical protein|uniref:Uncharacterized protein n=2 Tax=Streptomyces bottropensis TaxID=42235 RepID=M3F5L6_9ACTN|nr:MULTISPECIES: hypothetical protein [Streptomyces]EMF56888.1 hypothetical protein SBD_1719 [Streptomyces bottropensis ATCC 25435]MZD20491.1 hypothetical protein [Streptomyces sp. SID5476]
MSGQQQPSGARDERDRREPRGNRFDAGGNIDNSGIISGGNTNINSNNTNSNNTTNSHNITDSNNTTTIENKVKKFVLGNPALAVSLCVVLAAGGVWGGSELFGTAIGGGDTVDTSVVSQEGLAGARSTLEQIRVAERVADTAAWCELAQPSDSGCAAFVDSALNAKAESYREQVDAVGLGEPEESDGGARMQLRWKGQDQGYVSLAWNGGRWQLASTDYGLFKLCGTGVFISLVDARNQQAKCGPFSLPAS